MINTPDEIEYYKNQKGYNNNLIKRIKRNKTCGKIKKRDNSNKFIQIPSSKNVLVNNTNYSYLNFKNGITESQNPNNNLFSFKSLFKTKKGNLKTNNENNIFNDSIQNSILTDLSNYSLIKKSFEKNTRFKDIESSEKEKRKSFFASNQSPFLTMNKSNMTSLKNPKRKSIKLSVLTNNNNINNFKSQKKLSNLKDSFINNNERKQKLTRAITNTVKKKNGISNISRFDNNLKFLKDKLKQSLILRPAIKNRILSSKLKKTLLLNNSKNISNEELIKSDVNKDNSNSNNQNRD